MTEEKETRKDKAIEQDIRISQKFSMERAIARSGGKMLDGESPTPQLAQAKAEISTFIEKETSDSSGALIRTLITRVTNDMSVTQGSDSPLAVLKTIVSHILSEDSRLHEFVRQVDVESGIILHERPYFQQPGEEAHPDDEYTHASVARKLQQLLEKIER